MEIEGVDIKDDQLAVLIRLNTHWTFKNQVFQISDGIELRKFRRSPLKTLYKKLCEDLYFHDGDSDGVDLAIIIDSQHLDNVSADYNKPHSVASQVCNTLAICTCFPILSYTFIYTDDRFRTNRMPPMEVHSNYELHETLGYTSVITDEIQKQLSFIDKKYEEIITIDDKLLQDIRSCYALFSGDQRGRISNAFNFFFSAWRSHQMEHTCLNLAIVLESLFSPSEKDELTHRIAFNTCHFLGKTPSEREIIFGLVRKFYSIRSSIVHGANPKFEQLYIYTGVMFVVVADILKTLGTNKEKAAAFMNEKKRDELFRSWMF